MDNNQHKIGDRAVVMRQDHGKPEWSPEERAWAVAISQDLDDDGSHVIMIRRLKKLGPPDGVFVVEFVQDWAPGSPPQWKLIDEEEQTQSR